MNDPMTTVGNRFEHLQAILEHPSLEADQTIGFEAEAADAGTLADRMETSIRNVARDEGRAIVTIDFGGVLGTDEGYRCWGTVNLAVAEAST